MAGLAPAGLLGRWYREGTIDGAELVSSMVAQGYPEKAAQGFLAKAHADGAPSEWAAPDAGAVESSIPEYSGPRVPARKPREKGPALRGHPLD